MKKEKFKLFLSEYKPFLVVFFICLIFVEFPVNAQSWGGKRIPSVMVTEVIEETIATTKKIRAKIVSYSKSAVTPTINGEYKISDLRIGDKISKGDIIAKINSTELLHKIEIQKNLLENNNLILNDTSKQIEIEKEILLINKEQLEILYLKVKRHKELLNTKSISEQEYENILSSQLSALQQVKLREKTIGNLFFKEMQATNNIKRLELEIKKLKNDLKHYSIFSPESGQIVFLLLNKDGYIRQGEKIAEIQNLKNFELEAEIPIDYLSHIINSSEISGEDFLGNKILAKYRVILPFENLRTGTRTVRFEIQDLILESLKAIDAGVSLQIPTSVPTPLLTIPKDAVVPVGNGHVAFVFNEDGVIRKSLKLGGSFEDKIIVMQGLEKSDLVVVRGNELLKDGDKVKISGESNKKNTFKKTKIKGEKWYLEWEGRRGTQTGTLIIGKETSFFNDEKVKVTKKGNSFNFSSPLTLPFGTLNLLFEGEFSGDSLSGVLTISGLPNGETRKDSFSGKRIISE